MFSCRALFNQQNMGAQEFICIFIYVKGMEWMIDENHNQ